MSDKLLYLVILAIAILGAGSWLLLRTLSEKDKDTPLRPYALQILGLTFILPVVLVAAVAGNLGEQALSALLGAMIAFVFGGRFTAAPGPRDTSTQPSAGNAAPGAPSAETATPEARPDGGQPGPPPGPR